MGKYTDFGQRLVWYRSKAQMTQRELAEKSGVSLPQITRYESNRSTPRLAAVMKLAEALGLDPEAFTDTSPVPDATPAVLEFPEGGEVELLIPNDMVEKIKLLAEATGKTPSECMADIVELYLEDAHRKELEKRSGK